MKGYIAKSLRRKRVFRCAVSTGSDENAETVREIAAFDKKEAARLYRQRLAVDGIVITAFMPIMIREMKGGVVSE